MLGSCLLVTHSLAPADTLYHSLTQLLHPDTFSHPTHSLAPADSKPKPVSAIDDEACQVCNQKHQRALLLLCDGCDAGYAYIYSRTRTLSSPSFL